MFKFQPGHIKRFFIPFDARFRQDGQGALALPETIPAMPTNNRV